MLHSLLVLEYLTLFGTTISIGEHKSYADPLHIHRERVVNRWLGHSELLKNDSSTTLYTRCSVLSQYKRTCIAGTKVQLLTQRCYIQPTQTRDTNRSTSHEYTCLVAQPFGTSKASKASKAYNPPLTCPPPFPPLSLPLAPFFFFCMSMCACVHVLVSVHVRNHLVLAEKCK